MSRKIAFRASYISVITLFGAVINFLFQLLISRYFGASVATDLFFLAFSVPEWFINVFIAIIPITVVPVLAGKISTGEKRDAWKTVNSFFTFTLIVLAVLILLLQLNTELIADSLLASYGPAERQTFVAVLRIVIPMLLFSALSSIMMGVEYSFDEYLLPAIAPIVRALIMVSALVLFHRELGIFAAAWGCAAGAAAEFAVLYAKSGGRGARPALAFLNGHLRDFLKLLAPLFFGNLIFKSATFVDKYIASFLAVGAVTYLTFAGKVARLLSRFVSKGIGITIFPELSATHATGQWERFREIVKVGLNGVLFVVIPVLAVMVLFNEEIIYVLFRSPRFDLEDVRGAAAAFLLLSGMVLAFSINQIINKIYYSAKDTKLPVLINIIVFFPGIALKVLFARHIGFLGVALGSSLMALATVTVMIWVVARKRQLHIFRSIGAEAGKLCGAGVLAALLAYGLKHYLHANVVVFQDRPHIILYSLLLGLLMVLAYFTLAVGFRNTIALRFKNLIFEKLERTSHGRDNKE